MNIKTVAVILVLCSSSLASALSCDQLRDLKNQEDQKIAQYKIRIGQLNAELPLFQQTKQVALIALPGYTDAVKICAMSNDKTKTDVGAVGLAMEIINHIVVTDKVLQARLLKIIESGKDAPDWNLSALLKNYANKATLTPGDRLQILAMATAFDLLTEKDQAWRAEERSWLEAVKTDIATIRTLGPRLQAAYDDMISKDKNLDESCKRSVEQAAVFNQQIANADKGLVEIPQQIAGQVALIAQSSKVIDENPLCPQQDWVQRHSRDQK